MVLRRRREYKLIYDSRVDLYVVVDPNDEPLYAYPPESFDRALAYTKRLNQIRAGLNKGRKS
jgi:hypothetical protein